ncbi:MAG: hypothetical protein GEU93_16770 [Propionibacteriales bacterium]|nr:hypothetical protein [Propionibacteriales bacterium]MPZ67451.1 hypothetical protein [Pseudonocardiaceae bacterium]
MVSDTQVPSVLRWLLYRVGGRCECTGECGHSHSRGRCDVEHPSRLVAAPAEPSVSVPVAALVPPDELMVWCRDCLRSAQRRARVVAAPQPGLFEEWPS